MEQYNIKEPEKIILRDYLARDRTKLAMERTFLAYVRTALGLFSAGIACIKFINDYRIIYFLGYVMIFVSPIILLIGTIRYIRNRKSISTIPDNDLINRI